MPLSRSLRRLCLSFAVLCGVAGAVSANSDLPSVELLISVPDQKMAVVCEGGWLKKYKVSTSRFGIGDSYGSYKTPAGRLRVYEKLGGDLVSGAVIKHRAATGEVLQVNAPGRDPIISRIIWLEGLEAQNEHSRGRGIYIHGTTEEARIGQPVSWGCIRMRSQDVIELYEILPIGSTVVVSEESLPRLPKWKPAPPPSPVIIAATQTPPPPTQTPKPSASQPVKIAAIPARMTPPSGPTRLASLAVSRPVRIDRAPPPVAELLRPSDETPIPADPGAAEAFRGSILFAGLPMAPKPGSRSQPKQAEPVARILPARERALLQLIATPPAFDEFALAATFGIPPMNLVDLRRAEAQPELAAASMLAAPEPPPRLAFRTAPADRQPSETPEADVSQSAQSSFEPALSPRASLLP